ncbi:lytic polysaccharide monooxygenase [Endozoicomonas atrinae]|uniref:lytic polysaccharide monooxygenase n=1 Tax=Endozoicomonas atrinae TaxID=1333660 RepID=UPI0009F2A3B1|nr:lytic polysaccharide monooxygenase [Endozoicomonas atrinae]
MMYFTHIPYKKTFLAALSLSFTGNVLAHGWVSAPKARQVYCYDDGGYWTDSIPNEACQKAFDQSGDYPFTQKNEFSALVPDYNNQAAVEAVIKDGTLCAAGDTKKSGMDIPDKNWQKTPIKPGKHTLKIHVSAPHPNHFFQIYLSKPGFNSATQPLTWNDLELIAEHGEKQVVNGFYEMDFTIPEGRSGSAVLYTRWQRKDPAGEGFYNCSDLRFSDDGGTEPDPDPDPDPQPDLVKLGRYLTFTSNPAEPGDKARFRLRNGQGVDVVNETIVITEKNVDFTNWTAELARKVNDLHGKTVQIGFWHDEMNHYMYDEVNIFKNAVFAKSADYSYTTSVIDKDVPPPPSDYDYVYPDGMGSYSAGTKVLARDHNIYQCKPFPESGWCNQAPFYYEPATGLAWDQAWIRVN